MAYERVRSLGDELVALPDGKVPREELAERAMAPYADKPTCGGADAAQDERQTGTYPWYHYRWR